MAGNKKGSQAKGKPPPAKGRQPVRRPPAQPQRSQKRGVMAPVATNVSNGRSGSKVVRLVERERVATLAGSAAFKVQHTFKINPALPAFLPWLSTMAQLYEKYRVKSIRVMYHNLCGTNTAGNVLMSFDPDVLDSAPSDAVSFSQSTRYIDGAPWRMLTLNVPGSSQSFFTRSGEAPTGSDLKTYDYGQIHIATEAMADEATVGYIEIAYDLEFHERQPAPASGGSYSFRPQVFAGAPDPNQPFVVKHSIFEETIPGQSEKTKWTRISVDEVLPLVALVDDIGVSTFNGSLVLPPGAYAFSASMPAGGSHLAPSNINGEAQRDAAQYSPIAPGSGPLGPVAPLLVDRVCAALGIKILDESQKYVKWLQGSNYTPDLGYVGQPAFKWVDSVGTVIDAVGIADLTGVSLIASFGFDIKYTQSGRGGSNASVNGRPIEGTGCFTTFIAPSKPGEGIWPSAVITKVSEFAN